MILPAALALCLVAQVYPSPQSPGVPSAAAATPAAWKAGDLAYLAGTGYPPRYQHVRLLRPSGNPGEWIVAPAAGGDGYYIERPAREARLLRSPAPAPTTQAIDPPALPVVNATDPYNFGAFLNMTRTLRNLRPLAYDATLSGEAAANSARGFGHAYRGHARRQNVGMGSLPTVQQMWLGDPAHAAALLDPTLSAYGIANVNGIWTYNAR